MAMAADEKRVPFPAVDLTDSQGQPFQMKDYNGTIAVLNFWAAWCGPCRMELPELQKLYNEFGSKGFVVLAVAVDTPSQLAKPFLERLGVTLPLAFIDPQTQMQLGIDRIPFTVLLDKKGMIVRIYPGFAPEIMADLRRQVSTLVAERGSKGGK